MARPAVWSERASLVAAEFFRSVAHAIISRRRAQAESHLLRRFSISSDAELERLGIRRDEVLERIRSRTRS